jgi:hypothetical protein
MGGMLARERWRIDWRLKNLWGGTGDLSGAGIFGRAQDDTKNKIKNKYNTKGGSNREIGRKATLGLGSE